MTGWRGMTRTTIRTTFLMTATLTAAGCVSRAGPTPFPRGEVVDLSHEYGSKTIFWPTADPCRLEKVADGVTECGYYHAANKLASAERGGTHIEPPAHL